MYIISYYSAYLHWERVGTPFPHLFFRRPCSDMAALLRHINCRNYYYYYRTKNPNNYSIIIIIIIIISSQTLCNYCMYIDMQRERDNAFRNLFSRKSTVCV